MKKIIILLMITNFAVAQNVSSLSEAVKNFDLVKVREYLKGGADPNALVDGEPAVCFIARYNSVNTNPIFEELIKAGANPNSISREGNSAVAMATANVNLNNAIELIKRGANLNYQAKEGIFPPLQMALSHIYTYRQNQQFKDLLKLMIDNRADINIQNSQGSTCLMMSVRQNDFATAKYFIDLKADPNLKDFAGETALVMAADRGNVQIVELLLQNGADVNIITKDKETALIKAVQNGHKDAVDVLLKSKAKTNVQNTYKETALHIAVEKGYKEIAEMLKKSGAKK